MKANQNGFVLINVLWVVSIMVVLLSIHSVGLRYLTTATLAQQEQIKLENALEAAVYLTLYQLYSGQIDPASVPSP
ncbi:hypothetical protein [Aliamphritea spongicola]|nr:hypothetical protein [Aliamphritea spongicola]